MKKAIIPVVCFLLLALLPTACGTELKAPDLPDEITGPVVPVGTVYVDRTPEGASTLYAQFRAEGDQRIQVTHAPDGQDAAAAAVTAVYNADGEKLAENRDGEAFTVPCTAGQTYTVAVTTEAEGLLRVALLNEKAQKDYLPFPTALEGTPLPELPDVDPNTDPLQPARIEYIKNPDGHFIFGNNPEQIRFEDINIANLRNENMFGRYYFTFSHSVQSLRGLHDLYIGYRLVNNGDENLVVTVYNIGYQHEGEWLGARSWADFYNLEFMLPPDYFDEFGAETDTYLGQHFLQYTPRVWEPETYSIPPGEYMWILGGTTADNHRQINVAGTADIAFRWGCQNAAVLFDITQGSDITGSFYYYTDAALLDESQPEQGYIVWRDDIDYSKQYKGTDPTMGLIEADIAWTVNDNTPQGRLPVIYETQYDRRAARQRTPYNLYENTETYVIEGRSWTTSLNPQDGNHRSLGTDMSIFHGVDTEGNPILIDTLRADGDGNPANLGNWMIVYHSNYTFANAGDTERSFTIFQRGGTFFTAIRDRDGNVLQADMRVAPAVGQSADERFEIYTVTVAPRTVEQITVDWLILANSYGGMTHSVELT